jgi:ribose transport system substrate-binding protein
MKKRILGFVLALVMVGMLFTACSSAPQQASTAPSESQAASEAPAATEAPSAETSAATDTQTTYDVVFIAQSMSNESQAFASKMFQKHAAEFGLNVTIMDAKADPATEAQLVTNSIAQGAKAIFVNPNDINGIVPSLMAAKEAGVAVCMFSSDLGADNQQYRDFYVGANDVEAGKAAAQAFIDKFPDGANIVEIGGQSGHDAQIKRHDGFMQGLEGSNIKLLETQNCSAWATNDCLDIMQDFIVKYGDEIDGIFCHWDNGATGVIQALQNANLEIPYLVAVDGCRAGFDQVKAGTQAVCLMQNFETMATESLKLCRQVLDGQAAENPVNYIKWDTVTKDTIDSFTYPEW